MSTRQERREWEEFRNRYNFPPTRENFVAAYTQMFGTPPAETDVDAYIAEHDALKSRVGRKQKPRMATITRSYSWAMGHRLPNHNGKCANLHGHHYVLEIDMRGALISSGSSEGMVMDFADLDEQVHFVIDPWDHAMLLHTDDPITLEGYGIIRVSYVPTAENLALDLLRQLPEARRIKLYETPRSWAEVER